jgi:hypothetical protein
MPHIRNVDDFSDSERPIPCRLRESQDCPQRFFLPEDEERHWVHAHSNGLGSDDQLGRRISRDIDEMYVRRNSDDIYDQIDRRHGDDPYGRKVRRNSDDPYVVRDMRDTASPYSQTVRRDTDDTYDRRESSGEEYDRGSTRRRRR